MSEKSNFLHLTWYLAFRKQKNKFKKIMPTYLNFYFWLCYGKHELFSDSGWFCFKKLKPWMYFTRFFPRTSKIDLRLRFLSFDEKMRLICSYVLSILGKNSLILKKTCDFVLDFTELRLKLFLFFGKSEAHVLKKVV